MNKKQTRIISLLAIGILAILGSLYRLGFFQTKSKEKAEDTRTTKIAAPVSNAFAKSTPVKGIIIKEEELADIINVSGSTRPFEEVEISSEIAGKVQKLMFNEGNWVKKGTPLVQLKDDELKAQKQKLLVEKKLAEKIEERMKALYEKEGVSLQEYEVAAAETEKIAADIEVLNTQLEKTVIHAPFNGVLGLKTISEGQFISPGTSIVKLVVIQPIAIEFSIPEKYSGIIKKGSRVNFQLSGSTKNYFANVLASEAQIDPNTRTLTWKATYANSKREILPGAYISVNVPLQEYEESMVVPTEAIVPELGGKKVFLYKNGKAQEAKVETGIRKNEFIQLLTGVAPGDTVITTGVLQIRQGANVEITEIVSRR